MNDNADSGLLVRVRACVRNKTSTSQFRQLLGQVILEQARALPESVHRLVYLPNHPIMVPYLMNT